MATARDRQLVRYLRGEVAAHGAAHRARLAAALGPGGVRTAADLGRVPALPLDEMGDPAALVLRPRWSTIVGGGDRGAAARVGWSLLFGRRSRVAPRLERRYRPVHWVLSGGFPVGSSDADLDRLAGLGARWLAGIGVGTGDVLLGFLPAGPSLAYWQLVLGARQAGVPAVHVPPLPGPEDLARLRPTVLAGRPLDLARLLEGAGRAPGQPLAQVRLLVAAGERLDPGLRRRLEGLLQVAGAGVVSAWAPPGVRALWWDCGADTGLHTWPEAEVLEVVDPLSGEPVPPGADGEVVWTALGWFGTPLVRLRTGVFASLERPGCPACGAPGPRLVVTPSGPAYLAALDRHPGVAGWQVELRAGPGGEELLVFVTLARGTSLPPLLVDLDADLSATQYVVLDAAALDARLAAHGDRRVVDLRA